MLKETEKEEEGKVGFEGKKDIQEFHSNYISPK